MFVEGKKEEELEKKKRELIKGNARKMVHPSCAFKGDHITVDYDDAL